MKVRSRLSAATAVLAAAALISSLAACSSSGSASGSSGQIVIGSLGAYQGTTAGIYGGLPKVLSAWASATNAAGGINGHKVKVISIDTSQSSTAGPAAAHKLIDQEHVVAIIDNVDSTDGTWSSYASSKGVSVLDGTEDGIALYDPNHFNPFTSSVAAAVAVADVAKAHGGRLGMAYCTELPACAATISLFKAFAKPLGVKVTSTASVSAATADFTAICQQFKQASTSAIYYNNLGPTQATQMLQTCRQQGLDATPVLYGQGVAPQWKTDAAYRDSPVIDYVAPYFDTSIPGVKAYRDALGKYQPGLIGTQQDNSYGLAAWGSAQLFAAAARNAKGSVTASSVKLGLYAERATTLDGITAPVTFSPGQPTVANCYFTWSILDENQFGATNGGKPTCIPNSVIAPILQAVITATKAVAK